jgi:hypothetical protein
MKILVTQFYTNNLLYGKYTEEVNRKYCEKHGYEYFVEKDSDKINLFCQEQGIARQWYKVKLIQNILNESTKTFFGLGAGKPKYDWILFLDADAMISNHDKRIEDYIDDTKNLIVATETGHHSVTNTGVLLVKNDDWSKQFFSEWWDSKNWITGKHATELLDWAGGGDSADNAGVFKSGLWHEQTCLSVLYTQNKELKNRLKFVNAEEFNSVVFKQDAFIFHAYGYGHNRYRDIDSIYEAKIAIKEETNKIVIVYFVYCVNNYLEIAKKDFDRMVNSGLYGACDTMYVVCSIPNVSETDDNTKIYQEISKIYDGNEKVKIEKRYGNRFEHYGIVRAWIESHKSDGYLLYCHAKGVANVPTDSTPHSEWKKLGDASFIEMLQYFIIDNYKACIDKLQHYDQVNVSDSYSRGWPSGNFWWCRMDYLRKINFPFESTYDRWASEAWINFRSKKYSTFQLYDRFYFRDKFTFIPEDSYKNIESMKDKKIDLLYAKYMVLLEPENENDRNRPTETYEVDCTDFIRKNLNDNDQKGFNGIIVSHTGTLGPNVIKDPLYGVKKVLVTEFKVIGDDTIYRITTDEGDLLEYRIDTYKSIGYDFEYPDKKVREILKNE